MLKSILALAILSTVVACGTPPEFAPLSVRLYNSLEVPATVSVSYVSTTPELGIGVLISEATIQPGEELVVNAEKESVEVGERVWLTLRGAMGEEQDEGNWVKPIEARPYYFVLDRFEGVPLFSFINQAD